jgi:hypothetical protein
MDAKIRYFSAPFRAGRCPYGPQIASNRVSRAILVTGESPAMDELESKPSYWSVVGLVLWTGVVLLIIGGVVHLIGHFIFGRW